MAVSAVNLNDASLWQMTCRDDREAFEELVRRHQSVVSAVAYNGCGDLTQSEDIAQETFWAAWRDPTRLRAWLCGIARNLARNSNRRAARGASQLDESVDPAALTPEPHDEAVSREEETLVWDALEVIPENYREPLILFYREQQSVAEVAAALDVSPDAVKQWLSRGRQMLREQVASVVEGAPAAMLPAVPVLATSTGLLGGLAGGLLGLAGGWIECWAPAQFAPTNRERRHQLKVGRRILGVSIALSVLLFAVMYLQATKLGGAWIAGFTLGWVLFLNLYIWTEITLMVWAIKRIRTETPAESDPNDSPVKAYFQQKFVQTNGVSCWEGRVYRSQSSLLGLPLIDINVSDPVFTPNSSPADRPAPKQARGWIAIGDKADGILIAIGGVARGCIAVGGLALGIFRFGGFAIGLVSFGGLAIGALAHDFAVGGGASALHANDAEAHAVLDNHWLVTGMKRQAANNTWFTAVITVFSILPSGVITPLMYRRRGPNPAE